MPKAECIVDRQSPFVTLTILPSLLPFAFCFLLILLYIELRSTIENYQYDKYSNLVLKKESDKYYTTYSYTYDAYGNWTRKLESSHVGSSVFHYVTERIIRYY